MQTTMRAILDQLAQTNARASLRYTRHGYTHLAFLRLDLREILRDIDDSITARIPARSSQNSDASTRPFRLAELRQPITGRDKQP
jgi:hypothetical protein